MDYDGCMSQKKSEYEAFAELFSSTRSKLTRWPELDFVLPYLRPDAQVLDVGCGNGRARQFLGRDIVNKGNWQGIDISKKLINVARERHTGDKWTVGDMTKKLPMEDNSVDVIIALASFHHILSKAEQKRAIAEYHRVLRNGGVVFITTWALPKKYFWGNVLRGRWKNFIIPFGPEKIPRTYRRVSDIELKNLLQSGGMTVLTRGLTYHNSGDARNYFAVARKG